jgi:hypothetical protein
VRKAKLRQTYVESFVVDGIINEDVLFLVHSQEVASVAVFYYLAVRNLNVFEHLQVVVHDGKDFEA